MYYSFKLLYHSLSGVIVESNYENERIHADDVYDDVHTNVHVHVFPCQKNHSCSNEQIYSF